MQKHTALVLLGLFAASSAAAEPQLALRPQQASDRDLLGRSARLALPAAERTSAEAGGQLLRLAAIRVEFVREVPDDPATDGDGTFDYSAGDGSLEAPPHDRAYFERQLSGLVNYYQAVSTGVLSLQPTLYPAGDRQAYALPQPMRYYNPDTTEAALDIRLAEFFRDAVTAADGDVDYHEFDIVLIIHAGVGQDVAVLDVKPSNIPSAFLSFRELQAALAPGDPNFAGVAVEGGLHHVRDGLWIPETEVVPETASRPRIEFAMLGVMTSLVGSQLGLPSLFNTRSGAPGIGRFGLMDQGAGNELGKLPAGPCAWSRFTLGWETPTVVATGQLTLGAFLSPAAAPRLALVPINADEYFLIENRQTDPAGDGPFEIIIEGGVVTGVTNGEYDGGLPGSGLAIWHIDERVIAGGLEDNTVNVDYRHRGVDLEEADGVEDIGLRPDGGFGLAADLFAAPAATRFGPATQPSSATHAGHSTGIRIANISASQNTMTFEVERDLYQPGFPDSTGVAPAGPLAVGSGMVAYVDATGALHARLAAGVPAFPPLALGALPGTRTTIATLPTDQGGTGTALWVATAAGIEVVDANGEATAFASWRRPWVGRDAPLVAGTGAQALAIGVDTAGQLHAWRGATDVPTSNPPLAELRSNLALTGDGQLWAVTGNQLVSVDLPGIAHQSLPLPASVGAGPLWILVAKETRPAETVIWLIEEAGQLHVVDATGQLLGGPRRTGEPHRAPPALARLQDNGRLQAVVPGRGRVWAFSRSGALLPGWPAQLDTAASQQPITAGVVTADMEGDRRDEVLVASPTGGIFGFTHDGERLAGYPLNAGSQQLAGPALVDLDQDQDLELVAADQAGWLYAYDLAADGTDWPMSCSICAAVSMGAPESANGVEFEELVIYPNPARRGARIRFASGSDMELTVTIVDAAGRTVRQLQTGVLAHTTHEVFWDGRDTAGLPVASGVYSVQLAGRAGGRALRAQRSLAVAH